MLHIVGSKEVVFVFLDSGFLALHYNTCLFVALRDNNLGGKWSV